MNQCHFMGNIVRDPDMKEFGNDKKVVNFTIAINRHFKRGGKTEKETAFLDCEAWDTGASIIARYFKKGSPIIVHGSLKEDKWEDKTSGQNRTKLKLRVERFDFVPGNNKAASPTTLEERAKTTEEDEVDIADSVEAEGIPF